MNKKYYYIITIIIFILAVLLIAFIDNPKQEEIINNSVTQLANPAAQYCLDQGGIYDIRQTELGETGYCMKNSKECEEWSFYRKECSL